MITAVASSGVLVKAGFANTFRYSGCLFCGCQADNRKRYKEEENDHLDDQTGAGLAWGKHKLLNESIIVALFQGQFKSTVQCLTCHRKSRTFETFMYLSLPLASTSKCTLQVSLIFPFFNLCLLERPF